MPNYEKFLLVFCLKYDYFFTCLSVVIISKHETKTNKKAHICVLCGVELMYSTEISSSKIEYTARSHLSGSCNMPYRPNKVSVVSI